MRDLTIEQLDEIVKQTEELSYHELCRLDNYEELILIVTSRELNIPLFYFKNTKYNMTDVLKSTMLSETSTIHLFRYSKVEYILKSKEYNK